MRPHSAATKAPPSGRPLVFSLGPVGAVRLLGNDALGAKSARIGEHGRPIFGDVLVEQDAGLGIAQQPRQRSLAVEEREIAQILAIMLDQVEGRRGSRFERRPLVRVLSSGTANGQSKGPTSAGPSVGLVGARRACSSYSAELSPAPSGSHHSLK
jgi:hypothetical protein